MRLKKRQALSAVGPHARNLANLGNQVAQTGNQHLGVRNNQSQWKCSVGQCNLYDLPDLNCGWDILNSGSECTMAFPLSRSLLALTAGSPSRRSCIGMVVDPVRHCCGTFGCFSAKLAPWSPQPCQELVSRGSQACGPLFSEGLFQGPL